MFHIVPISFVPMILVLAASSAGAAVIDFASPTYTDGELVGQDGWTTNTGTWVVSNGAARSVANVTANTSAQRSWTAAETGLATAPTGSTWGQFRVTLNSSSQTGRIATVDFGRAANRRVIEFDIFGNGTVSFRQNIGNVPNPQTTVTLTNALTVGQSSLFKLHINYDNQTFVLYQDNLALNNGNPYVFSDVRSPNALGSTSLINRGVADTVTVDDIGLGTGVTPVPEPAGAALLGAGAPMLVSRRR